MPCQGRAQNLFLIFTSSTTELTRPNREAQVEALLPSKKLDIAEAAIFLSSFVFFYFYIISYGLILDSGEIANISFVYRLIDKGALTKSFIKPLPNLLASEKNLLSEGIKLDRIYKISQSMLLLKIGYE